MLVFAFDRDWTVDVSPHPSRAAVPLEWVRGLAHDTDHAVHAAVRALADEVAIPGVVDTEGMHPDDPDDPDDPRVSAGCPRGGPTASTRTVPALRQGRPGSGASRNGAVTREFGSTDEPLVVGDFYGDVPGHPPLRVGPTWRSLPGADV